MGMSWGEKLKYAPEPAVTLLLFSFMLSMPIRVQYVYSRISEYKGFNYSYHSKPTSGCDNITMDVNSTQSRLQQEVQSFAAQFNIALSFCDTIPALFSLLFFGALSDKIGRKPIMILSCTLFMIESGLMLLIMYFKLPIYVIFGGVILNSLGGSFTGLSLATLAYLADTTEKEKLAGRMAFFEAFLFLGLMIGTFSSGPFIEEYGFIYPQWCAFASVGLGILYLIFILPESLHRNSSLTNQEPISMKEIKNICYQPVSMYKTVMKPRLGRWKIFLGAAITIVSYGIVMSTLSVKSLYLLNRPFCFPAKDLGNFQGATFIFMTLGLIVGMKILRRIMPELLLVLLSLTTGCLGHVVMGLARTKLMIFVSAAVKGFGGLATPFMRAYISNTVEEDEKGAVFSVISSLEMLAIFLGNFIFNTVYAKINATGNTQWFWAVPSSLFAIPIILTIVYWIKQRQADKLLVGNDFVRLEEE